MITNFTNFDDNKEHWGIRGLNRDQPYPTHEYSCKRLQGEELEEHLKDVQSAREKILSQFKL